MRRIGKGGPFRAGEQLRGLRGLGSLGDYLGQPGDRAVRPTKEELQVTGMRTKKPPPSSRTDKLNRRFIQDDRDLETVITIPKPSRQFIITPRLLTNAAVKLDIGIKNRCDIAIWNVSTATIWVNTSQAVAANAGVPLGPSSAGGFNGGAISVDVNEEVRFWGIASSAGSFLVIVMEASKA